MDRVLSTEELDGFYEKFWNEAKCLEIELIGTINYQH